MEPPQLLNLHLALVMLFSSSLLREFTRTKTYCYDRFKERLTEFNRFVYGQSLHTAFTNMLDWMLLTLSNGLVTNTRVLCMYYMKELILLNAILH